MIRLYVLKLEQLVDEVRIIFTVHSSSSTPASSGTLDRESHEDTGGLALRGWKHILVLLWQKMHLHIVLFEPYPYYHLTMFRALMTNPAQTSMHLRQGCYGIEGQ